MHHWTLRVIPVVCAAAILPCSAGSGFEFLWESTLHVAAARSSAPLYTMEDGSEVWQFAGSGTGDLSWRRDRGGNRFLQFGLGASVESIEESRRTEPDPRTLALRGWVEGDVNFRGTSRLYPVTFAVLAERSDVVRGDVERSDRGRYSGAVMLTHKGSTRRKLHRGSHRPACELAATILTYTRENVADDREAGDANLDRSDTGGYQTLDIEHQWVFGELTGVAPKCFRTGPFRRPLYHQQTHLWGGLTHRRERARGEDAAADLRAFRVGVLGPPVGKWGAGIDARVVAGARNFETTRRDEFLEYSLAARWPGLLKKLEWSVLRQSDLRVGLSHSRVDSNEPGFSYNDRALFVSLDVGFGKPPPGGTITDGTAGLERRDTPSGPAPRLPSKP